MPDDYSAQLDAVLLKINAQVSGKTARKMLTAIGGKLHADIARYPPTSPANFRPGNNGYSWYERAVGTKTVTDITYATSQRFKSKWPDSPKFQNDFKAVYDNRTTYGGYLMGDVQVAWAKRVGWQQMRDVLEDNSKSYAELARRVIAASNKS